MKLPSRRALLKTGILASLLIILLTMVTSVLIERKIETEIKSRGGNTEAISFSLVRRVLKVQDLTWKSPSDSATGASHSAHIELISIKGIQLIPLFFNKQLHISSILIDGGNVSIIKNFKSDSTTSKKSSIPEISIDHFELKNIHAEVQDQCLTILSTDINISLSSVHFKNETPWEVLSNTNQSDFTIKNLRWLSAGGPYLTTADSIVFHRTNQTLEISSVHLIPLLGKYEFGQRAEKQVTWTVFDAEKVNFSGFDFVKLQDSLFSVSKIDVTKPNLWVFCDKRLPFKNPYTPLPVQMMKSLPFGLKVDSVLIHAGKIRHEEMAKEGGKPGYIIFSGIEGRISNFNNRVFSDRPAFAIIKANGTVSKSGYIEAELMLPAEEGKKYSVKGMVKHMPLPELNTITESLAFFRFESGHLNKMIFSFDHDDYSSTGKLEVNYENLKMTGLVKGSKDKAVSPFKTLLINTVVKNDKGKETPREDRTGVIHAERDRKKFVANLWVKSLFSGVQSIILPSRAKKKGNKV